MNINWIGIKTIIKKELDRSLRVPGQTFGAPIMTALLFFLVFGLSLGRSVGKVSGLSYAEFIMPGLIMMNMLMNSFMSVSSAFLLSKMMNTLSDLLVSPLSYLEMVIGYTVSAAIRGLITGIIIYMVGLFFVPMHIAHPFYLLSFAVIVSITFSLFGLIIGIWADNFEKVSIFPTFLITPLSFLGGVFYSVHTLPPILQTISFANPLLYMINGLRYGFYGVSDVGAFTPYAISLALLGLLTFWTWYLFKTGYKIRN